MQDFLTKAKENMSMEGKIYQDLTTDEGSYRQTFGQGRFDNFTAASSDFFFIP